VQRGEHTSAARNAGQRQDPGRGRSLRYQRRLPAMRNSLAIGDVLHKVYGDPSARGRACQMTPNCRCRSTRSIRLMNGASRLFPARLPASGDAIWKYLTALILGHMPRLEPMAMNYD